MRPAGAYRIAIEQSLCQGPATSREAASRACLSVVDARYTLDNMRRAGDVVRTTKRVDGVKRPVPVYALAAGVRESQPQAPPGAGRSEMQFPPVYWWAE